MISTKSGRGPGLEPVTVDDVDSQLAIERSALGCILENPRLIGEAAPDLADCFLLSDHRKMWQAIIDLDGENLVPDVALVSDAGQVDVSYVSGLLFSGYVLANFRTYVGRIRAASEERRFRQLSQELTVADTHARANILQQIEKALAFGTGNHIRSFEEVEDVLSISTNSDVSICRDLLEPGAITMIVSSPGVGKSFLAMSLAVNVATGGTFLDRACTPLRVMMLDKENPLRLLQKRLRLIAGGAVQGLKLWCGASADPPPMIGDPRLLAIAREQRTLFIFDTLTRFHTANENSATGNGDDDAGMSFVTGQARLLANLGSSVLILHHRGKGVARYRGSEEILANVDIALELVRSSQNGRKLHIFKNRDGKDNFDISISCDFERGVFTCTDAIVVAECKQPEEVLGTLIAQKPGICVNEIAAAGGLRRTRAIQLLQNGEGHLWRSEPGPRRSRIYFPLAIDSQSIRATGSQKGRELVPNFPATGSCTDSQCTEPI